MPLSNLCVSECSMSDIADHECHEEPQSDGTRSRRGRTRLLHALRIYAVKRRALRLVAPRRRAEVDVTRAGGGTCCGAGGSANETADHNAGRSADQADCRARGGACRGAALDALRLVIAAGCQ